MCSKAINGDEEGIRYVNNVDVSGILKSKFASLIEEKCREWEEVKLLSDM